MSNTVNYDEMKTIVEDPKVLIIDVRSPQEVQSTGKIGNSINIPVDEVTTILKGNKESFEEKFGRPAPKPEDPIIFHCLKGGRALKAWEASTSIGFTNAKYYPGSYTEWSSKN
ncbi:unnamed protein product [Psylliodes chrysocephalus]|uniref:Rhodanese domain-containing protein n=1 Tax=Psylliodes chrysocephalus TaxID=3402493 RepID=A0A9P0D5P3_9CUCU|nr:unnamed protein product [Psylliodes chrysocephala]